MSGVPTAFLLPGLMRVRFLAKAAVLLLLGQGLVQLSSAQVIRGRITDAQTGVSLPTASVHVDGTYRGTITNEEGFYELSVDAFPVMLVVRFLGYETARRRVDEADGQVQDFSLLPVPYELETITVSGENPAIEIMRAVIREKQRWWPALESYEVQAYTRFSIVGDSSVVWIRESASVAYWDRGRGMKERIIGNRSTDSPFFDDSVMPVAQTVANLYDDNVFIAGHNLIGVTHPDALGAYDFELEGIHSLDGAVVYDIAVKPKSRLASAFHGRVAVLDSAFAIIDAELRPGESFLFPQPIKRYEVTYRQQFSSYGGDYWMPVDFRSDILAEINMPGLLSFPAFRLNHVARFTDYQVNVAVPEELYSEERSLVLDSAAVEAGAVFEEPGMVVPLTADETAAYDNPEIKQEFADAFTPGGLVGRMARRYGSFEVGQNGEASDTSRSGRRSTILRRIRPSLWYNRVEGAHLGLRTSSELGRHFSLGGSAAWISGLSGSDRWSWHASAGVKSAGRSYVFADGRYEFRVARRYGEESYVSPFHNGLVLLFGGDDYFDYYGRDGFSIDVGVSLARSNARIWGTFRSEDHRSLPHTTSYDLLGRPPQRENWAIEPGYLQSVSANMTVGRRGFFASREGNRALSIGAELSLPESDYGFQRYWVDASWRQATLGRRRLLPGVLDLRLRAGYGSTNMPSQRAFMVEIQAGSFAPFGSLRSVDGHPFEGDDMVAFFWEHNFRTMIFEALGLRGVAERGYSIMVFGGHARTWLPQRYTGGEDTGPARLGTSGVFHELGISLAGVLGFFRIDFAKPLAGGPVHVGIGAYSPF